MSNPSDCNPCCETPTNVSVPGVQGESAFTTVAADFVVPALGNQTSVDVVSTNFMAVGEVLFIEGAGWFEVININSSTSVLLEYLNDPINTNAAANIASGALVTPSATPGLNAYTVTTGAFTVPAIGANTASVAVGSSVWMQVGQTIFVAGAGYFSVVSKADSTHFVGTYLNVAFNTFAGNVIGAGAGVSPGGPALAVPITIAQGGTGAITKALAQVALGLGQTVTETSSSALAYDITNGYALITGMTIAVPASGTGLYKVEGRITVRYTGVTFAASRTLSIRIRNTTTNTTLSETTRETGIHTTTTFPDFDYTLPIKATTIATADVLELQCFLNTVESAGTSVVGAASICITPLAIA